jgi:hypothetical protein
LTASRAWLLVLMLQQQCSLWCQLVLCWPLGLPLHWLPGYLLQHLWRQRGWCPCRQQQQQKQHTGRALVNESLLVLLLLLLLDAIQPQL